MSLAAIQPDNSEKSCKKTPQRIFAIVDSGTGVPAADEIAIKERSMVCFFGYVFSLCS